MIKIEMTEENKIALKILKDIASDLEDPISEDVIESIYMEEAAQQFNPDRSVSTKKVNGIIDKYVEMLILKGEE
jgi:hypothetical protein